jgi:hypothetical protein
VTSRLSLSIFAIEADRSAVLAIQCQRHSEAEAISCEEDFRHQLSLLRSGGKPLCDDLTIFRVRLVRQSEREAYFKKATPLLIGGGQLAVLLVDLDEPS